MIPVLVTILLSSVKFAMTFPVAILRFNFSFFETILWINAGGILGIYFFAYLSEWLISWWTQTVKPGSKQDNTNPAKKIFTKRNRRLVRIKNKYGLWGIAFTTPVLLSIPLGVFLMVRYYRMVKSRFYCLIIANVVWSFVYTGFYKFFGGLLFTGV